MRIRNALAYSPCLIRSFAIKISAEETLPLVYRESRQKHDRARRLSEIWSSGHISNFEYLMELNTLAGRSYNDLSQYPVFPWVLKDYTSESIDLMDPRVYRDLSKPIGAQNPERLKIFQDRYESLRQLCESSDSQDIEVIPQFHYGSHYSSLAIATYYLIRLEPFYSLHREIQGLVNANVFFSARYMTPSIVCYLSKQEVK